MVIRGCLVAVAAVLALSACAPQQSAPPTTTPAASRPMPSPTPTDVAAGTPFDDTCSVAWPTAPVRSVDATQVRYTCKALPTDQYLFVLAVYADPDLDVPDNADPVPVSGVVTGSAVTTEGYRMLIIDAS